jgi:GT2 family glycosyltransferase
MLDFDHERIADVDWMSGACWLVSRAAYERIGALDEGYFWTFEDVDYCQRTKRAGLRVVYFPEVSVIHHVGSSARTAPARAVVARHRGMWRYYRTYMQPRDRILRLAINGLMALSIAGRCTVHLVTGIAGRALSHGEA